VQQQQQQQAMTAVTAAAAQCGSVSNPLRVERLSIVMSTAR